ncbi:biotin--[acetyl-CoA-carboxylase] ligase [Sedimentibacter sp. MB31-C6]|uniref:biotin--[acetyl-CoA-carboxylase] ligase n=1 Tax=Sedimentibacter sp. MB31-C6 TaxID=3109366 RepID=UPI002DDD81B9|nr:biotin--[acetyl-CoA-carboxylase] ligase [Sedimentibacter sp. MB36-C1]WSI05321.1 biotin--[acetyl-CoA-carboxylase] ligase [Sedimentibacter sp. MB36-C1]
MYDLNKIKGILNTNYIGNTIIQYEEVPSTFAKAKNIFDTCTDGSVILSENQSMCKVRFGRLWECYPYKNIYLSILFKDELDSYEISKFEVIVSAAVCESINSIYNIVSKTKWPNDILINSKKISSISCQSITRNKKDAGLIISILINVNIDEDELSEGIREKATSIKIELNTLNEREILIGYILNNVEKYYDELKKHGSINNALNICYDNSAIVGEYIGAIKPGRKTVKKCNVKSINEEGLLVVVDEKGNEEILNSGEIIIKYDGKT